MYSSIANPTLIFILANTGLLTRNPVSSDLDRRNLSAFSKRLPVAKSIVVDTQKLTHCQTNKKLPKYDRIASYKANMLIYKI